MPEILEVASEARVSVGSTSGVSNDLLSVVIVRLLTVALAIMAQRIPGRSHTFGPGVPKGYQSWPAIEADPGTGHTCQRLKFYVSPKGAATAEDEAFPVGTALVMEAGASPDSDGERPLPVFVMGKVSSIKIFLAHSEDTVQHRQAGGSPGRKGLDPGLVPAIVERAHRAGLRVSAHVETAADFRVALLAGVDELAHVPGGVLGADRPGFADGAD